MARQPSSRGARTRGGSTARGGSTKRGSSTSRQNIVVALSFPDAPQTERAIDILEKLRAEVWGWKFQFESFLHGYKKDVRKMKKEMRRMKRMLKGVLADKGMHYLDFYSSPSP